MVCHFFNYLIFKNTLKTHFNFFIPRNENFKNTKKHILIFLYLEMKTLKTLKTQKNIFRNSAFLIILFFKKYFDNTFF